jgi:hypothetical protein
MEVFYSYDGRDLRGQYTFGDSGEALSPDTDQNLRQKAGQGWIQSHHTREGFIGGKDALAKGCGYLLESSVLKQSGK